MRTDDEIREAVFASKADDGVRRRGPGRPPDGSKSRRDEPPIFLRLNPEERALAERVAAALKTNRSDAFRRAMTELARTLGIA